MAQTGSVQNHQRHQHGVPACSRLRCLVGGDVGHAQRLGVEEPFVGNCTTLAIPTDAGRERTGAGGSITYGPINTMNAECVNLYPPGQQDPGGYAFVRRLK
jgi:hypothetical protein